MSIARRLAIPLMAAMLANSCAVLQRTEGKAAPGASISWPAPPEAPRIRYVKSVHSAQDWGIERSGLQRLFDWLVSARPENLVRPTGVAAAGSTLYIADPGDHALRIFDGERNRALRITEAGDLRLASPVAVAVHGADSVYVVDSVLKRVFLFGRDGGFRGVAAGEGLEQPVGIAYDAGDDHLYVADAAANRVVAFDAKGHVVGSRGEGGSDAGEFNRPTHISLTPDGTLLVTDALNFRVQSILHDGRFFWAFGDQGDGSGSLAGPKGVASDRAGHVFVVDALFDVVQIFDVDGTLLLGFGGHGEQPGQFWLPNGIFIDPDDRVYVADAYNRRIEVFEEIAPK